MNKGHLRVSAHLIMDLPIKLRHSIPYNENEIPILWEELLINPYNSLAKS